MRFLVATQPGLGHIYPMVPIARALSRRGHQVRFACARRMLPLMAELGFETTAAGLDWSESTAEESFPELGGLSLARQSLFFMREIFAKEAALRMVPDLVALTEEWKADVILHNDFDFAACVAADRLQIPHATAGVTLFFSPDVMKRHVGRSLQQLRAHFDLEEDRDLEMLYRYLYLSFAPPSLHLPDTSVPGTLHYCRPEFFDRPSRVELPEWLDRLPDRPTVYATLGTVFNRTPGVFATVLSALAELPINLIVTIGSDQDRHQFGPQPDNVHIEPFVPNSLLIPRCDVVVTNGSFSSVLLAFMNQVPLVLVPLSSDEPLNAMRCRELGVAEVLQHPEASTWFRYLGLEGVEPFSAESLRRAVLQWIERPPEPSLARLQSEMNALPPIENAVELLCGLR